MPGSRYCCLLLLISATSSLAAPQDYFTIHVVDADTGRGVPLVELRTVNDVRYFTDSNGVVAYGEPGMANRDTFFHVSSHGYEYPEDGFGYRGKRLKIVPGGQATLKLKRINIAERLYRVTGADIYRDSVLVDRMTPLAHPLLNGNVFGSDSVLNVVFRDRIYWFWGDTNRPSYPLGNFHVPGATSMLPGRGGLSPAEGIDLTYFVDPDGFAKPTAKLPGPGPTWLDALVVLKRDDERMFAKYAKIKPPMTTYEQGLVEFDDETKSFQQVLRFDENAPIVPAGHPFVHTHEGRSYIYFATPYPYIRIPAAVSSLLSPPEYESYSYLKANANLTQQTVTQLASCIDRGEDGRLSLDWRRNLAPLTVELEDHLFKQGLVRQDERLYHAEDVTTGETIRLHRGSVYWNDYRQRWIMIAVQQFGKASLLGEVWYLEASTPEGPWSRARQVVTHDHYSFYNPKQHPMLAEERGRWIYFEGTYANTFSGTQRPTPRYNYNQVMYRLDLADERLH